MKTQVKSKLTLELPADAAAKLANVIEDAKRGDAKAIQFLQEMSKNGMEVESIRLRHPHRREFATYDPNWDGENPADSRVSC